VKEKGPFGLHICGVLVVLVSSLRPPFLEEIHWLYRLWREMAETGRVITQLFFSREKKEREADRLACFASSVKFFAGRVPLLKSDEEVPPEFSTGYVSQYFPDLGLSNRGSTRS